jgi:hypothetical protein
MRTRIDDDFMTAAHDGRVIATARYRSHAAADGQSAWIVSGLPRRLFTRNQAITAMVQHQLLGQSEVSLREVLTHGQQRFTGQPGNRVGQAVTEIEPGRVTAPTEPQERINGLSPVPIAERDLLDTELVEQPNDEVARVTAQAGCQYQAGFSERVT